MARADHARVGLNIRCAIYTRKSSDEGLEQEFNSLDAQREACEAYIVSQRHAGWVALANMYDDGGLSGGSMERPALKRLLEDIKASKVQTVVVYRVDRLTRRRMGGRRPTFFPQGTLSDAAEPDSIGAKSLTKAQPTPASTRPSSIRSFGRSCRTSSRPIGRSARWRWARRRRACWQA